MPHIIFNSPSSQFRDGPHFLLKMLGLINPVSPEYHLSYCGGEEHKAKSQL